MILIGDAGGTKTDWRILQDDTIDQVRTAGFNPHTHSLQEYVSHLTEQFQGRIEAIEKMYFYGASVYPGNEEVHAAFSSLFTNAEVHLNSDLIGACRSLSEHEPAFVGILGTGSAGCYYDGEMLAEHPPSLGYSLGDEGSGARLGILFLKTALRKRFSSEVQELFDQTFGLTKDDVYAELYRGDRPVSYLASFTKFLNEHRSLPEIDNLLRSEFRNYFEAYFGRMTDTDAYQFHFTGSIAFHFQDYLRGVGAELGFSIGRIIQGPIAGLALYHQKYG